MSYPTKYSIVKGWGGRPNFQYSHGLKMTPDDIDEGNVIIDHFLKEAIDDWEHRQQPNAAYDQHYEGQGAVRSGSEDYDSKQVQYQYEERPSTSANYDPEPSDEESAAQYYESGVNAQYYESGDSAQYESSVASVGAQYYEEPSTGVQYYQEPARDDHGYEHQPDTLYGHDSEASYAGAPYEPPSGAYGDANFENSDGGYDAGGGTADHSDSYDDDGYASAGSYGDYDDYDDYSE